MSSTDRARASDIRQPRRAYEQAVSEISGGLLQTLYFFRFKIGPGHSPRSDNWDALDFTDSFHGTLDGPSHVPACIA